MKQYPLLKWILVGLVLICVIKALAEVPPSNWVVNGIIQMPITTALTKTSKPLGDIARQVRADKMNRPKAKITFEKDNTLPSSQQKK